MPQNNPRQEAELREQILKEFKQVLKLAPADYTENCTNVVISMVNAYTTKLLNEQLDTFQKFIDTSKEINLGYHGRPDCKSCGLMEAIEEAIENERKKLNETGAST